MPGEELGEYYTVPVILSMAGVEKQANRLISKQMGDIGKSGAQEFTKGFASEARSSESQVKKLSDTYDKLKDKVEDAADKMKVAQAGVNDVTEKGITSGKRYETAVAAQNKAQRDHARAVKASEDALKAYETAAKRATSASEDIRDSVSSGFRGAADEALSAGKESATGFYEGFAGATVLTRIGTAGGPVGLALAGLAVVGLGAGKILGDNIAIGMGQVATLDRFQARLGVDDATMTKYGEAAASAYMNAFGQTVEDNLTTLQFAVQGGIIDASASEAEAQKIIQQIDTIRNVSEADAREITRAMNQLVRTGLARDFEEASDILVTGFQQGLDVSDDFLDSITEYSTQFRELGLNAGDTLGLLQQGLQGGARDTDVVADALKEFAIRAKDGSELTANAFTALGMNAQETMAIFAAGGEPAREKLDEVLDRIREIPSAYDQAIVTTALFGTQAEDIQDAFNKFNLDTAKTEVGDFAGSAERAAETAADNAATKWEEAGRRIERTFADLRSRMANWFDFIPEWVINVLDPGGQTVGDAGGPAINDPREQGPMILPLPSMGGVGRSAGGGPTGSPILDSIPSAGGPGFTIGGPGLPRSGGGNSLPTLGSVPYGLPKGTSINYGDRGFPDWVYQVAEEFGVKASTYAGHQEGSGANQGIDWSGPVENMQRLAEYLAQVPSMEQVIWSNPKTGQKIGVADGQLVGPGTSQPGYYSADWGGHTDHVHTRQSSPIPLPTGTPTGTIALSSGSSGGLSDSLYQDASGRWHSRLPAWNHLIQRESGGINQQQKIIDVNSGGNEAEGLFQITPKTWAAHGGTKYAPTPLGATPQQQAEIAAAIFRANPSGRDWGAGLSGREDPAQLSAELGSSATGPGPVSPDVHNAFGAGYEPGIGTPGYDEYGKPGYYETDPRRIAQAQRSAEDSQRRIGEADEAITEINDQIAEAQAERERIAGLSEVDRTMQGLSLDKADADLERLRDQKEKAELAAERAREDAEWAQEDLAEAEKGSFRAAREAPKTSKKDGAGRGDSELDEIGSIAGSFLKETFGVGSWLPDIFDNPWLKGADALVGSGVEMLNAYANGEWNPGGLLGAALGIPPEQQGPQDGTTSAAFGMPNVAAPPMPAPGVHDGSGMQPGPTIDASTNINGNVGWSPDEIERRRRQNEHRAVARAGVPALGAP